MITGRFAADSRAAARPSEPPSGAGPGGRSTRAPGRPSSSDMENTWSIGKSTKPTPEGAPTAARSASSTSRPASSADCAVAAKRASGATNGTWSISCSEPMPQRCAGARPPSTTSGDWFCCAAAIALIPLVMPGPAVSAATPGDLRHFRPAFGGERRGLLVAGVDQPDTLVAAPVVDGKQVAAG